MSPTLVDLIDTAETSALSAKRAAEIARAAAKANPADPQLRAAVVAAEEAATVAGRQIVAWRFEEALDRWIDRHAEDAVPIDQTLLALAPRSRGEVDLYWLAASHVARSGMTVPRNWRSPVSGEPIAPSSPD